MRKSIRWKYINIIFYLSNCFFIYPYHCDCICLCVYFSLSLSVALSISLTCPLYRTLSLSLSLSLWKFNFNFLFIFIFELQLLSRLIAHLVPISTVPTSLDKYPTSISVILFLRYSSFHVFSLWSSWLSSRHEGDQPTSNITMICS